MQMANISRWTLAYFGCALVALVVALALMASGFGFPADSFAAPKTLIVVHLLAIGWMTLLMFGALFQFLPVLVGQQLAFPRLTPIALALIVSGLLLLLAGFAGLDGWTGFAGELLPVGGGVLICGFLVAVSVLLATLLRAQSVPLPAGFVAVALLSILITAFVGETLASALTGLVGGEFSVALVTHGVSLHAAFGLGGWLTLAAMGVSYRLLSMFLVSPERQGAWPRIVFWSGFGTLGALYLALGVLLVLNLSWSVALVAACFAGMVCVCAYLRDVVALYRARRRRGLELHTLAAVAAFVMLGVGAVLLLASFVLGSEAAMTAAVYVLVLGWLSGLGLAMLYKIIPFLTWLECFAPKMGRMPTPRVQDLVAEARARLWFALYFGAVGIAAVAILAQAPLFVRVAIGLQLAAVLLLVRHYYRARRLADLPMQWSAQPRPHLFVPTKDPRRFI